MQALRVLILGGTTEASALARLLEGDPAFAATVSLAGRTRAPVLPALPCRIGGFGGIDGLTRHLREHGVEALVDATHPFAQQMTRHAIAAAGAACVPLLALRRPPWLAGPGDHWHIVANMQEALAALGEAPRRVLLTIGQQELAAFVAGPAHHYVIRSVDPPPDDARPKYCVVISARGPFAIDDEVALLTRRRIEIIVTKNSGGAATIAKLQAANLLGLPVIMVERPPAPQVETVADAQAARHWLHAIAALRGV